MTDANQSACANLLLRRLSADDFSRLSDFLEPVQLNQNDNLAEFGAVGRYVYFPETGVASITSQGDPMKIEIGLVGREGFVGIPVLLADGSWPAASFVQIAGSFLKAPADAFREIVRASPAMHDLFLHYVQAYLIQVSSTAIANGAFNIEERLARWLLMASDRVDGSEIGLTHDFLAMMLGVRRPGVTVATHVLEGEHAIRATRGRIQIVNRAKLLELAGGSYGVAEAEYDRLIRHPADGAAAPSPTAVEPRTNPTPMPSREANLGGHSVLVIEDDYDLARDTGRALAEAGGRVLGPVGSEAQALALVARKAVRCALVDINLGEGARFTVADALQERGVPFVFVTGYDDHVIPERFDAVERVRKPAELRQVVEAAARLCAGRDRSAQPLGRPAT